ncbi:MAG TPA: HAMP domain-containing sensor histidine kinase, partial [Gemmatimonadaceae bacterium]
SGLGRVMIFDRGGGLLADTSLTAEARGARELTTPAPIGAHAAGRVALTPRTAGGTRWIVLARDLDDTDAVAATIQVAFAADSFFTSLATLAQSENASFAVLAGRDTVLERGSALDDSPPHRLTVLMPGGARWTVLYSHQRGVQGVRLALFVLAILTISLLGAAVIRERRQAIAIRERSAELERLYSEVARANTAKSEFLANISHELRTPLNAIVGFVELLKDGVYGELSPRQVPPVDRIAASATHLRHLVDQVLDIAKIAAGRLEVHPETVTLRPFVLNVASELESLVNERGLSFSIAVGGSLPRVRTDPAHLRQILVNLIGNAIKYTPSGGVAVRARLLVPPTQPLPDRISTPTDDPVLASRAPSPNASWVALQVTDSGIGIPPADQDRIFDEFEQVNAGPRGESMQRGTGLGLAISRRLARLLGGDISVDSQVGKGSTFTLWLPVAPGDLMAQSGERATTAVATGD